MNANDEFSPDALGDLVARHPALFHGQSPARSYLPLGWLALADALCIDLEVILGDQCSQFVFTQVRQRWAALRVYWAVQNTENLLDPDIGGGRRAGSNSPSELNEPRFRRQVVERPLGLRLTLSPDTPLANAIVDRIARAEEVSVVTCEWCGDPGHPWVGGLGRPGYHYVACDQHRCERAVPQEQWLARTGASRADVEIDDDVVRAVFQMNGGDAGRASAWYDEPLPTFSGKTPRELVASGRKGILIAYLASLLIGPAG